MARPFLVPVTLPGPPTQDQHAATKAYVDTGLATKAPTTHQHSGGDITSGTIAAARLPLVPNPPLALTYGTNPTIDASLGNYRVITATGDLTLGTTINNPGDGQMLRVRVIASGAQRTVTFAAALRRATGIASTLVIPSGKRGDIGMLYEAGDGWTVLAATAQQ